MCILFVPEERLHLWPEPVPPAGDQEGAQPHPGAGQGQEAEGPAQPEQGEVRKVRQEGQEGQKGMS